MTAAVLSAAKEALRVPPVKPGGHAVTPPQSISVSHLNKTNATKITQLYQSSMATEHVTKSLVLGNNASLPLLAGVQCSLADSSVQGFTWLTLKCSWGLCLICWLNWGKIRFKISQVVGRITIQTARPARIRRKQLCLNFGCDIYWL